MTDDWLDWYKCERRDLRLAVWSRTWLHSLNATYELTVFPKYPCHVSHHMFSKVGLLSVEFRFDTKITPTGLTLMRLKKSCHLRWFTLTVVLC